MAREYGNGVSIELIFSGSIPTKPKDWSLGVVAHNTQHIYAFRDSEDNWVYVGRTYDPAVRWFRHKKKAPWWHSTRSVDLWLVTGPDRATVDAAVCEIEKQFILDLNPSQNIVRAKVA